MMTLKLHCKPNDRLALKIYNLILIEKLPPVKLANEIAMIMMIVAVQQDDPIGAIDTLACAACEHLESWRAEGFEL